MKIHSLLAVFLLAGAVWAEPFVWPESWSVNSSAEAKPGGSLRGSTLSDFKTLNPFLSTESPSIPAILSADVGLLRRDPYTWDFIPYMAESYQASEDGLTLTFNLRPGMKWSDGKPITSADWVTTWKIHTDPAVGSNSYDSFFIEDKPITVSAPDPQTVVFEFPVPDANGLSLASFSPWPDHIFGPVYLESGADGIKAMWGSGEEPSKVVSFGAFSFESYRPGERVTFKKNPYFGEWNIDQAGNPLPYLDTYEVRIVGGQDADLAAFLSGDTDIFSTTNPDHVAEIQGAIQSNRLAAVLKTNVSPVASSSYIIFNWNKKSDPEKERLFRDVRFRQAMSHLLNRAAIVEVVYGGFGTPTYTAVYPVLSEWQNPDVAKYDYDPQRASELLAELGYQEKDSEGWLVNSEGRRLEFTLSTNSGNTIREQTARIFADEAAKIGVKVNFTPIDFNVLVGQLNSTGEDRPFDAILLGLTGGSLDWPFGENVVPCAGNLHSFNGSGECLDSQEEEMEKLFFQGRQTLDLEARKKIGMQIQELEAELLGFIYIAGPNQHVAWSQKLGGEHPDEILNSLFGQRELELTFNK